VAAAVEVATAAPAAAPAVAPAADSDANDGEAFLSIPQPDAGEFAPQAALILSAKELAVCLPDVFRDIVQAAQGHVPVLCLASDASDRQAALRVLRRAGLGDDAVRFVSMPLDTMWVRDYGPFFARRPNGGVWVLDADYSPADDGAEVRWRDNNAPRLIGSALGLPVEALPLRLAGGNVLTNGGGLVVTTAEVLRDNADRGYDAATIQRLLLRHLGCDRWICLPELDDERTGHVDMYVTFTAENVAVVSRLDKQSDPVNAAILDAAARQLEGAATRLGPMKVYRIPMEPGSDGVWRSYTNVIYANGVLMVPSFRSADKDRQDAAMSLYARLLPGWKIVAIPCDDLARNEGLLHCICRNVPQYVPVRVRPGCEGDDGLDLALVSGADGQAMPAGPDEMLREGFPGAAAEARPSPAEPWIGEEVSGRALGGDAGAAGAAARLSRGFFIAR